MNYRLTCFIAKSHEAHHGLRSPPKLNMAQGFDFTKAPTVGLEPRREPNTDELGRFKVQYSLERPSLFSYGQRMKRLSFL